jgi:serine/threonine-protein phosphatase 2A regulatory subunit A
VRLNVITRLDSINDVLGVEVLSQSLLPAISNLAMDGKWRVRLAVIEHIPLLLTQMSAGFFAEKLSDMCLSWLLDHVHAVRHAAADNLQVLHSRLGETWTITQAIPKLDVLTAHRNYLFRLTGLHVVRVLCSALSLSLIEKHLVPKVFHLCKDHVANVRMNCSRAFISLLKVLPSTSTYRKVIIENLNELSADTDRDVKAAALQVSSLKAYMC